jgi:hypothetical protein
MPIVDFDTECWGDPWFQERTPLAKLLFVYLWTNTHRSVAGFYVITKKTIGDETGLKPQQIETYLGELKPKVRYDPEQSVCWVIKHIRRQFLRSGLISEQVRKGIRKAALKLSYHPFFQEFIDAYPEIFDPEEKETLYRPSETVYRPSIDYPGGGGGGGGGGGNDLREPNKDKNIKPSRPRFENSEEMRLSTLLFKKIRERDDKAKAPNFQKWAAVVNLLIRKDGRSADEIEQIILWCQEDSFWQNNILSMATLREKFTQLKLKMEKGEGFSGIKTWLDMKEDQDEKRGSGPLCLINGKT